VPGILSAKSSTVKLPSVVSKVAVGFAMFRPLL
jgi:hypothetical protein